MIYVLRVSNEGKRGRKTLSPIYSLEKIRLSLPLWRTTWACICGQPGQHRKNSVSKEEKNPNIDMDSMLESVTGSVWRDSVFLLLCQGEGMGHFWRSLSVSAPWEKTHARTTVLSWAQLQLGFLMRHSCLQTQLSRLDVTLSLSLFSASVPSGRLTSDLNEIGQEKPWSHRGRVVGFLELSFPSECRGCLASSLPRVYILPEVVDSPRTQNPASGQQPGSQKPAGIDRAQLRLHGVFYFACLVFGFWYFFPIFTSCGHSEFTCELMFASSHSFCWTLTSGPGHS